LWTKSLKNMYKDFKPSQPAAIFVGQTPVGLLEPSAPTFDCGYAPLRGAGPRPAVSRLVSTPVREWQGYVMTSAKYRCVVLGALTSLAGRGDNSKEVLNLVIWKAVPSNGAGAAVRADSSAGNPGGMA
jgi:hypothetical protein